jgi:hypothetical protein
MKRFLFFAIATAMLGMTFTSCDKENEDENDSTVKASLEGRWDGAPAGFPYEHQNMTLIFKGNDVDVYIIPWGDHLKGTYKYENDSLYFSFDMKNAFDARMYTGEDAWSWNFGDGALNSETLELSYTEAMPYQWYPMDESDFEMDIEFLRSFSFKLTDEKTAIGGAAGSHMELEFHKK